VTQRQRRKLTAVDDPLASVTAPPAAGSPTPTTVPSGRAPRSRSGGSELEALFVRLPAAEAEALARAAFELRLHKREIVAALIARHVDARSEAGLAHVRQLVDDYRAVVG
jgi:hypothetical protein